MVDLKQESLFSKVCPTTPPPQALRKSLSRSKIFNFKRFQFIKSIQHIKQIDIEIEFELALLTYKVFSCKDVRSKFLGVRLLAVQSNTQSRS